jgi:hypothetical protein
MPRNKLTKDEIHCFVLKQKSKLFKDDTRYSSDPRVLADKYLNEILLYFINGNIFLVIWLYKSNKNIHFSYEQI